MDIRRPEHYYRAALERIRQARYLYAEGTSYALAMYAAGVAVECLFRAFRARKSSEFESRHDLLLLFGECGMLRIADDQLRKKGWSDEQLANYHRDLRTAVGDVVNLWSNNYRYASENRLLAHLKRMKQYHKAKGDLLKAKALELFSAANVLVAKGVLIWE